MKRKDKQKVIPRKPNTTKYTASASKCTAGIAEAKAELNTIQALS